MADILMLQAIELAKKAAKKTEAAYSSAFERASGFGASDFGEACEAIGHLCVAVEMLAARVALISIPLDGRAPLPAEHAAEHAAETRARGHMDKRAVVLNPPWFDLRVEAQDDGSVHIIQDGHGEIDTIVVARESIGGLITALMEMENG